MRALFFLLASLLITVAPGCSGTGTPAVEPPILKPVIEPAPVSVAVYYSEGSMKPKGSPAVNHYLTRATQVFVKEEGQWKIRSSHWSPVAGGSGTTQTAEQ